MKIFRTTKSQLEWKKIPQIKYKWDLPILINDNLEVIVGNSLRDSFSEDILVLVLNNNEAISEACFELETLISKENNLSRISNFYQIFYQYLYDYKHINEQMELFEIKETSLITEESYKKPPLMSYRNNKENEESFTNDFEIDMEIMKELL